MTTQLEQPRLSPPQDETNLEDSAPLDRQEIRPSRRARLRVSMRRLMRRWRGTEAYRVLMQYSAPLRRAFRRWQGTRSYAITVKWGRITIGTILILAGIAMLVLPGQGILTIIAGLAIMSPDVPFAHRLMERLKERVRATEAKVRETRNRKKGRKNKS